MQVRGCVHCPRAPKWQRMRWIEKKKKRHRPIRTPSIVGRRTHVCSLQPAGATGTVGRKLVFGFDLPGPQRCWKSVRQGHALLKWTLLAFVRSALWKIIKKLFIHPLPSTHCQVYFQLKNKELECKETECIKFKNMQKQIEIPQRPFKEVNEIRSVHMSKKKNLRYCTVCQSQTLTHRQWREGFIDQWGFTKVSRLKPGWEDGDFGSGAGEGWRPCEVISQPRCASGLHSRSPPFHHLPAPPCLDHLLPWPQFSHLCRWHTAEPAQACTSGCLWLLLSVGSTDRSSHRQREISKRRTESKKVDWLHRSPLWQWGEVPVWQSRADGGFAESDQDHTLQLWQHTRPLVSFFRCLLPRWPASHSEPKLAAMHTVHCTPGGFAHSTNTSCRPRRSRLY